MKLSSQDYSQVSDFQGKKRMIFTLLLIMFTEVLGFSLMMPVLPFLAQSLGLNMLQIGLVSSVFSICQLFASPITGKLSDRYGRKPLLILSQLSTFTGFLILGFANAIWILIFARIVDGLLGSNMTVVQAALTDITNPKDRTKIFTLSSGVFGAGLIIGPALGGFLAGFSYFLPMFCAAGVSLISIFLVITILPETYKHQTTGFSLRFNDIVPIDAIRKYSHTPKIRNQILMLAFYNFGFMLFITNFTLITIKEFDVTVLYAGYYRTWIGIFRVLLQFFFVDRLMKWKGENRILISGIVAMIFTMLSMIFTIVVIPVDLIVFIPITFIAYGTGIARPILTGQLTNTVEKNEYATVLGINNSLNSLAQIISPILGGAILLYLHSILIMSLSHFTYITQFCVIQMRKKVL